MEPPKKRIISGGILIWIVIFIAALLITQLLSSKNKVKLNLSYSEFLEQVDSSKIDSCNFKGHKVMGTFKIPFRVPIGVSSKAIEYNEFSLIIPFDDPDLPKFLAKNGVKVTSQEETSGFWTIVLNILPWLLIPLLYFLFIRQMQGPQKSIFSFGKNKARRIQRDKQKITFDDAAGCEEAKNELQEVIEFLKNPHKFSRLGGRIPRGVLLLGSPGTGKTLLAKAVAGEADVPFFSISGSDFVEMFVGVGASRVRDLFDEAKHNAPCIVFIDEIDAVGRYRGAGLGGGNDEREQTLNQLLVEMDGFDPNEGIIIIAATNRPDVLDPALLRPGRFDRRIVVDAPDIKGRYEILKVHSRNKPLSDNADLNIVAKSTPGLVGADLENIVNEAALLAARNNKDQIEQQDFEEAMDKVMMGLIRKSVTISDTEKKISAYHEAGHALVGKFMPDGDPIHKVSIIPRGIGIGGATYFLPQEERRVYRKSYLKSMLARFLGGRAAEIVIFDDPSTGAGNDLQRATEIAHRMVAEWGMSEKLGPLNFADNSKEVFLGKEIISRARLSDDTSKLIDNEIRKLVEEAQDKALEILRDNIDALHRLANALLDKEVIAGDEIDDIIGLKKDEIDEENIDDT
ncbi:ATP-dependent zinc metalloprotease FtsH [bacterium]|nr:ATP-dependent zinc metalloprotease FtsH [bacterium]